MDQLAMSGVLEHRPDPQRTSILICSATSLRDLGAVRRQTGGFSGAARDLERALGIFRELGDRLGEATALRDLGAVRT